MTDPRAGQPAAAQDLVNIAKLVTAYYAVHPDYGSVDDFKTLVEAERACAMVLEHLTTRSG